MRAVDCIAALLVAGCAGLVAGCAGRHAPTADYTEPAAVGLAPPASPVETLEAAAAHLDPAVRRLALEVLIARSDAPGGGEWGPRATHDPSPWVQRGAVDALAMRVGDPASVALILDLSARPGASLSSRCAAAEALGRAGDPRGLPVAIALYTAEPQVFLAVPCALAAARMGDPDGVSVVLQAIDEGELPVDLSFYASLATSGLTELGPVLAEASGEVDEAIAVAVAGAAFALDPAKGERALMQVLDQGSPGTRREAIELLAGMDGDAASALLAKLARGSKDDSRAQLALVARGEGDPGQLIAAMGASQREVRALAVRAAAGLAASEAPSRRDRRLARKVVLLGLSDVEDIVRLEAARAVLSSPVDVPSDALTPLLADDASMVQVEAARALVSRDVDT